MSRPSFRTRLEQPQLIAVPVIFDAMSARVAFEAGFDVLSIGSLAVSASKYALPDTGFMSLDDMADCVRNVRYAVPESTIIADAEAGFGNAVHVVRTVRVLEAAGANAFHIEDQLFGKHVTHRPLIESAEVTADKIAAAVSARSSSECVVIGRTDTQWATPLDGDQSYGTDEVIRRSNLFVEAGADMILLPLTPLEQMATIVAEINAPVMTSAALLPDDTTWSDVENTGLKVLLYHDIGINAAIANMRRVFNDLATSHSLASARSHLMPSMEIDSFLGIDELRETAARFSVLPGIK